ncbi:DUF3592 domain-containing protein [Streptomyces sp. NPDC058385]|uniref:DUF3592 domain-containing protein n=1 Tax=Streptomyces sp. NPDC058385 TaxID=3346473 RepID=UPI00365177DE
MGPLWLLALILFISGLVLAVSQVLQLVTEVLRRSTGTVVDATVTGHVASNEASNAASYAALHPVVSWTAADGTAHEQALPDEVGPHALPEGRRVRVRFDPSHPGLAALDTDGRYRSCVAWLWAGTVLWAGTLAVVVWRMAYVLNESQGYVSRW